jgi:type IV secretory pathway VirB10-like protein
VENKIYQDNLQANMKKNFDKDSADKNQTEENKHNKNNDKNIPLLLKQDQKENFKNENNIDAPIELNVLRQTNSENLEDKIRLYSDIYKYSNPVKNNGQLIIKETYWKELNKKMNKNETYIADNEIKTENKSSMNLHQGKTVLRIVPGSSFFARLTIPLNSVYTGQVKPIAKIVNGELKGYRIIGNASPTQENNGLIIKFDRLVSPDGEEYLINAIGVQTKNLSPKFVDNIDRHLFPRITLTTLATIVDALFNKTSNIQGYGGPAQSILSQELQQMASEYKTEIMVNPKYFVVIFY